MPTLHPPQRRLPPYFGSILIAVLATEKPTVNVRRATSMHRMAVVLLLGILFFNKELG